MCHICLNTFSFNNLYITSNPNPITYNPITSVPKLKKYEAKIVISQLASDDTRSRVSDDLTAKGAGNILVEWFDKTSEDQLLLNTLEPFTMTWSDQEYAPYFKLARILPKSFLNPVTCS